VTLTGFCAIYLLINLFIYVCLLSSPLEGLEVEAGTTATAMCPAVYWHISGKDVCLIGARVARIPSLSHVS
jgi:hypothetical protein